MSQTPDPPLQAKKTFTLIAGETGNSRNVLNGTRTGAAVGYTRPGDTGDTRDNRGSYTDGFTDVIVRADSKSRPSDF